MYVVDPDPTFVHPVKVKVPVDGGYSDQEFRVKFRVLPVEQSAAFDLEDKKGSTDFLTSVTVEFLDLVDRAEKPISCNDELRKKLIGNPFVRVGLLNAYYGAMGGVALGN